MAKYYDIDNDTRINGKLTVNGDAIIPSSNLLVGGNITGNIISGSTAQITTINGTTANITNVTSTGTISGGTVKGNGATLIVNGTTASGGTVPISNGWAYTHENKIGSQGHIPTGGTATTFLRGDNTWVTPTDTYVSGLSSTAGGNGTLTVTRNTGGNLTVNLAHNHDTSYLGISGTAVNADKLDNIDSSQFVRSDTDDYFSGLLTSNKSSRATMTSGNYRINSYMPNKLVNGSGEWNSGYGWTIVSGSATSQFEAESGRMLFLNPSTKVYQDIYTYQANSLSLYVWSALGTLGMLVTIEEYSNDRLSLIKTHFSDDPINNASKAYDFTTTSGLGPDSNNGRYVRITLDNTDSANGRRIRTWLNYGSNAFVSYGLEESFYNLSNRLFTSSWDLKSNGNTVWHSGNFTPSLKLDASTYNTHIVTYGSGSHVPTGGTTSQYLRGDGTWQTLNDYYVNSVSSTDGGDGTLTLGRNGLTSLTIDLAHNHDDRYYTETEVNTLLSGKSDTTHNHDSTYLKLGGGTVTGQITMGNSTLYTSANVQTPSILFNLSGDPMSIYGEQYGSNLSRLVIQASDDGGTTDYVTIRNRHFSNGDLDVADFFRDNVNMNVTLNAKAGLGVTGNIAVTGTVDGVDISTHASSTGVSTHIPTGGTTSQYLRGDGTWATPPDTDTNNYVSALSSTAGGNGTLTVTRNGLTSLTLDLSHTHSQYVTNNSTNQSVLTGFTMSGNAYVGTSSTAGALIVRTTSGASSIQLAGDNATQLAGTGVYMNASGNAKFSGTVTANTISVTSTGLVTNLNAEMVNGIREKYIAKNDSIYEVGGKGVYTGLNVTAQTIPNMTVLVNAGTAHTDSGMRVVYNNTNVSLATSSATYDRKDVIYIQGSSASANEGVIAVATGTPASTPAEPSIPSDAIKLAVVLVPKSIGSIQNTHITYDMLYMPLKSSGGNTYLRSGIYMQDDAVITSNTNSVITFAKPIKGVSATSLTFTAGTTSVIWTHNLNAGTNYAVRLSCNSAEPHIYWSSKLTDKITINLDDACESDVVVDVSLEYY